MRAPRLPDSRAAFTRLRALFAVAAALLASAACDQTTAPQTKSSGDLHFLKFPQGVPVVAAETTSFYAKVGRASAVTVWNKATPGATDSTRFLDFSIDQQSLDRGPDGLRYTGGDSVLIMIVVPDPAQLSVRFSPSGLTFDAQHPAKLRFYFASVGNDLNGDGVVDQADTDAIQKLSMWRQEAVGQPWFKMSSAVSTTSKTVDATVAGFTGFAVAF